jgi:hypothetical protein
MPDAKESTTEKEKTNYLTLGAAICQSVLHTEIRPSHMNARAALAEFVSAFGHTGKGFPRFQSGLGFRV